MKKNRNAFFNDGSMNFQNYNPMLAGQYPNNAGMPIQPNNFQGPYMEVEERLAKIERQISRLEHRLNQIESSSTKSTDDFESTTNNMYML